jgi:patatin-like phospholipase/acyl hydrolase
VSSTLAAGVGHAAAGVEHAAAGVEHAAAGVEHIAAGVEHIAAGDTELTCLVLAFPFPEWAVCQSPTRRYVVSPFTIVSFVGGGIRGLMSATILQRLSDYRPSILTDTDLFAGCSTGSVIVSELVAGKTPADLITLFTTSEVKFYDNQNFVPTQPAYPIDEVFASQVALHGDKRLIDLEQKVLMVSFNVGGIERNDDGVLVPIPWAPILYNNMTSGNADTLVAKAATSSGAMPGQLGSLDGNVDGAFVNHDPTLPAIALAVSLGHKLEEIVVICIGTGLMYDWIASDTHDWGADQWMKGDGNPFNNTPPFLINQTSPSPVLDLCLSGTSAELMPLLAGLMLGDRYVNLNPVLPCFIPENSTSPQDLDLLQAKGAAVDIERAKSLLDAHWPDTLAVVEPGGRSAATAGAPAGSPTDAVYEIRSLLDGCVMVASGGSLEPGAPVKTGDGSQQPPSAGRTWLLVTVEPGWWFIRAADTDLVMTVAADLPDPPIVLAPPKVEGLDSQLWSLVPTAKLGYWYIQSKLDASVMDIQGFVVGPGVQIIGYARKYDGFENQAWGFAPVA